MQSLQSFFSRSQVILTAVSAKQPVVLSADALKLVGGGLPRVSQVMSSDAVAVAQPLPRVS